MDLTEIIARDSVTAAWFWVTSEGPLWSYAENEKFDAVFVRETNMVVGGGYHERRTFYIQGITTAQVDGGRIVRPDLPDVLAHVIADAHEAAQYDTFAEWADDIRDTSLGYQDALNDFEEFEIQTVRHRALVAWLGDSYDEYVKAAQEYVAEH